MCHVFAGQDPWRYASETRRLRLNGQSTSIRLENAFWEILDEIAESDGVSTPCFISQLHEEVWQLHGKPDNFTSLLRCACLKFEAMRDTHTGQQQASYLPEQRVGVSS